MTVIEPARTHLMHSNSWLEPGARGSRDQWHMWRTRQWPFNFLTPGDTILVVSGGSVDEGRIVSENRIDHLLKADYSSHEQAWKCLVMVSRPRRGSRWALDQAAVPRPRVHAGRA